MQGPRHVDERRRRFHPRMREQPSPAHFASTTSCVYPSGLPAAGDVCSARFQRSLSWRSLADPRSLLKLWNLPTRTPEAILADMEAMMRTSSHADYKAASNLQLSAELQALLSASADATSRRRPSLSLGPPLQLVDYCPRSTSSATQLLAFALSCHLHQFPPAPDQAGRVMPYVLADPAFNAAEDQLAHNERQMKSAEDILQRQGAVSRRTFRSSRQPRWRLCRSQWEQQATSHDAATSLPMSKERRGTTIGSQRNNNETMKRDPCAAVRDHWLP